MTTKTYRLKAAQIDRRWHVLDAAGRPLGRLASEAAHLLLGKHKPDYEPHLAMGDFVVVVNAGQVHLTGKKAEQKVYYRHSGYPGGLRERSFEEQMERDPRRVVETAVRGMLPHNSRGRELFRRLKVYAEADHPHTAQLMAGTGARARKRAAQEAAAKTAPRRRAAKAAEPEAAAPAPAPAEESPAAAADTPVRTGALSRWLRSELDQEAERLGIEIEAGWNKGDVVAAIEEHRASVEGDG
ncbi:MAG: 50S ribosomal protein L13 [Dehalococcoidia bacterium]